MTVMATYSLSSLAMVIATATTTNSITCSPYDGDGDGNNKYFFPSLVVTVTAMAFLKSLSPCNGDNGGNSN